MSGYGLALTVSARRGSYSDARAGATETVTALVIDLFCGLGGWSKAVSAMIAKIPEPLARHIARTFKPAEDTCKGLAA